VNGLFNNILTRGAFVSYLLLMVVGCGPAPARLVTVSGNTMGTTYTVKVITNEIDKNALEPLVQQSVDRIDYLMSNYKVDSELSVLNRSELGTTIEISDETKEVLALSSDIHQLSMGAFDISLAPIVNLWGFGPNRSDSQVPTDEAIAQALAKTGIDGLTVVGHSAMRTREISLNLSAIAKGYAVDKVAKMLSSKGYEHFLIEVGGELKAQGTNHEQKPWRIAIELPDATKREMFSVIKLRNLSMATSGDYRNYFEVDGQRYSHTIDPKTGMPITHNLASVTVLDASAARADGLATAINVMGSEKGLALANTHNIPIMVIMKEVGGFVAETSAAFDEYILSQQKSAD
jgi:thiamine biosynthesis lipoprotein